MRQRRQPVELACVKVWMIVGLVVMLVPGFAVVGAEAGIGGKDTPIWPATAAVGTTFNAQLVILNQSTSPNDTENVTLVSVFVTPSCGTPSPTICPIAAVDPGVFSLLTAVGAPLTVFRVAC